RRVQMKRARAEAHQVRVARTANRAEKLEVVDRFQNVCLALAVVANDYHALGRKRELRTHDVAEVTDRETIEKRHWYLASRRGDASASPSACVEAGVRFSRNADI